MTPPLNVAQLNARLESVAERLGIPVARARLMICTLIVSQMLPDAVAIKGGMGVKLRMGESGTRATADLDVSTKARGEVFESEFRARLGEGWGAVPASKGELRKNPKASDRVAFTASLRRGKLYDPGLSQPQYVMHPYRVTLSFLGREWAGLDVEVSDPEIEPYAHTRLEVDGELMELSADFGFGKLKPVELIDVEYQIAQKIHALTDPAYSRAHDLIDLQLLWESGPDLLALRNFCVRTFEFRRAQQWPPLPLRSMDDWNTAYDDARQETLVVGETSVLPDIGSARDWLTQVITSVDDAS